MIRSRTYHNKIGCALITVFSIYKLNTLFSIYKLNFQENALSMIITGSIAINDLFSYRLIFFFSF
jgi:hypothetical protein